MKAASNLCIQNRVLSLKGTTEAENGVLGSLGHRTRIMLLKPMRELRPALPAPRFQTVSASHRAGGVVLARKLAIRKAERCSR